MVYLFREDVWINYKSNDEGQQLRPLSALYTLPDKTMEENISCVYLNANQATHPMPIMQWGIASCEYHYQFVCKIWTKTGIAKISLQKKKLNGKSN